MGAIDTISHDRWPRQSDNVGQPAEVTFHYDATRSIPGVIVRDDREAPFEMLIRLDDGRVVRAAECQYHLRRATR